MNIYIDKLKDLGLEHHAMETETLLKAGATTKRTKVDLHKLSKRWFIIQYQERENKYIINGFRYCMYGSFTQEIQTSPNY